MIENNGYEKICSSVSGVCFGVQHLWFGNCTGETRGCEGRTFGKKKKKYKGYQKPKSKKILGIFKRKTDCGCPNH